MMHSATMQCLLKVSELGSIRRAAEALNLASSAVNRRILNLEQDLGVALFKRTQRGVVPTAAGQLLLRHVRDTLGDYERTLDEIRSETGILSGEVRIIGIGSFVDCILPSAIVEFADAHPAMHFRVVHGDIGHVVRELRSGHFDLGITFLDNRIRELELCAKLDTGVGAIMASSHPLARRKSVTLTECAAFSTSMFSERWIIEPLVDSEFQRTGVEFRPRVITNSMAIMEAAIRARLGIGFFTPIGFIEDIQKGTIVHVPLEAGDFSPEGIGLFATKPALDSPTLRATIAFLSELFQDLQSRLDAIKGAGPDKRGQPASVDRAR